MRSMTGFGAASVQRAALALRAEVRAVNHKFLQLKVRLPGELVFLEPDVEELVRSRLERGAVTLNITSHGAAALSPIELNLPVARRYKALLARLAKEIGAEPRIELDAFAALPGVFNAEPDTKALQIGRKALLAVVAAALDDLESMRTREGAALARDLAKHVAEIARLVKRIEGRMPVVVRTLQENLHKRVSDLVGQTLTIQPADLAREIALLADRLDVSEELTRLKSHVEHFGALAKKSGAVGRQLDFLVQELLREANTIGSKCNDAEVAHAVVELKTSIERLREQVQNVE